MAVVESTASFNVIDGNDAVVVQKDVADVPGGAVLDTTGYTNGDVLKAGHVIVKVTSSGTYKPLNVTGSNYASVGSGEEVVGLLKHTVRKDKALVSVLTIGVVKESLLPFTLTAEIKGKLVGIKYV